MNPVKTVTFFGASTGVGLTALKETLQKGHICIAVCRTPSKLIDIFPPGSASNLKVIQGNAHDVNVVAQAILKEDGNIVDTILSTIGGKPVVTLTSMTIDDPNVCRKGMATLLEALALVRSNGATGRPRILVCSTTGMSRHGRDIPIAMIPLYHIMLKVPHEDKRIMEDDLVNSGEDFTIVRASLLFEGKEPKPVRVGIEDPKSGRESEAIGYFISREDTGKWFAENLIAVNDTTYLNKIAMITN